MPGGQRNPGGSGLRGSSVSSGVTTRRVRPLGASRYARPDAPAPRPVRCHRGRPSGTDRTRRAGAPREPAADQGPRLPRDRTRRLPPARAPAGPGPDHRRAGRPRARAPPAQGRPARALHRAGGAPGPQRDALLPAPRRAPRRVPADRLHADRRARLRGVQPHHPADARDVDHPGRPRPHPPAPARGTVRRRPAHRRDRQRTDPGSRRPGRGRDGHPDRQARAVHGGERHPPGADPARLARRRDRQPSPPRRPAVRRPSRAAAARSRVRRPDRGVRRGRGRGLARLRHPVGGLQAGERAAHPRPLPRPRARRSTTTSRGRRRSSLGGCPGGPARPRHDASPRRASCSPVPGAAGIGIARLLRLAMLDDGHVRGRRAARARAGRFARPGARSARGPRRDQARAGAAERRLHRVRLHDRDSRRSSRRSSASDRPS